MNKWRTVMFGFALMVLLLWFIPASAQKSDPKLVRSAQITSSAPEKAASIIGGTGRISAIKANQVTIEAVNDVSRRVTVQVRNASMLRIGDQVTIRGHILSATAVSRAPSAMARAADGMQVSQETQQAARGVQADRMPADPRAIRPPSAASGPPVSMPGASARPAAPEHRVEGIPDPERVSDDIPAARPAVDPSTGQSLATVPSRPKRGLPSPGAERMADDGDGGDTGGDTETEIAREAVADADKMQEELDMTPKPDKTRGTSGPLRGTDVDSLIRTMDKINPFAWSIWKLGGAPPPPKPGPGGKSALTAGETVAKTPGPRRPGSDPNPGPGLRESSTQAATENVTDTGPGRRGPGPDPGPQAKSAPAPGETVSATHAGPRRPGSDPYPGPGIKDAKSTQAAGGKVMHTAAGPKSPGPDPGPLPAQTRSARITGAPKNLNLVVGNQAKVIAVNGNQVTLQNLNDASRRTTVQVNDASLFKSGQTVGIQGSTMTLQSASRTSSQGSATATSTPGKRGPGPDPAPPAKQVR